MTTSGCERQNGWILLVGHVGDMTHSFLSRTDQGDVNRLEPELEGRGIGSEPEVVLRRIDELRVGVEAVLLDAEAALGVEVLLAPARLSGVEV